jgi:hypothetical protein
MQYLHSHPESPAFVESGFGVHAKGGPRAEDIAGIIGG